MIATLLALIIVGHTSCPLRAWAGAHAHQVEGRGSRSGLLGPGQGSRLPEWDPQGLCLNWEKGRRRVSPPPPPRPVLSGNIQFCKGKRCWAIFGCTNPWISDPPPPFSNEGPVHTMQLFVGCGMKFFVALSIPLQSPPPPLHSETSESVYGGDIQSIRTNH